MTDDLTTINSQLPESFRKEDILKLLDDVCDPEIPVLSIIDLGIVRSLEITPQPDHSNNITITITPTYSGCPAMDVIAFNIRMKLLQHHFKDVIINQRLSPAWSTDWMTQKGKDKLKVYGIAPPQKNKQRLNKLFETAEPVACPQCNSTNTRLISEFGSTACKALHQCNDCKEPFDHFKCH
jgi:ring-1,2-phenylacetyl-CoA epoxidase subunit PaaD